MKITPDDISISFANGAGEVVSEVKNGRVVSALTIAQSIRRSSDPHRAAITSFIHRECPHGSNKHFYYFEDGSFLTFEVSYLAVEDGGAQ